MVKWPFRRSTLEKTVWTVVVWFVFGLFVLSRLISLLPRSDSVVEGA